MKCVVTRHFWQDQNGQDRLRIIAENKEKGVYIILGYSQPERVGEWKLTYKRWELKDPQDN